GDRPPCIHRVRVRVPAHQGAEEAGAGRALAVRDDPACEPGRHHPAGHHPGGPVDHRRHARSQHVRLLDHAPDLGHLAVEAGPHRARRCAHRAGARRRAHRGRPALGAHAPGRGAGGSPQQGHRHTGRHQARHPRGVREDLDHHGRRQQRL
ncbi:MAG: hypothetical protein AVDCRST_MAG76-3323, partial [uncultured Acidimicrobiales bacterium]